MAFRIKPNGDIETDSPEEALQMQRQIIQKNEHPSTLANNRGPSSWGSMSSSLGSNARAMLKFLLTKPNGVRIADVAKEIGLRDARGLGSINRQVRNWGKSAFGLSAEECIRTYGRTLPDNTYATFVVVEEPLAKKIKENEKVLI
jgi:hypothetical protein